MVLARFALVQSLVQAATLVTGIIIVRAVGKEDYAHYTVANGWLGALVTLSNSGVGDAATAIGGRVWQDAERLGRVVRTAMRLRRWLAATAIGPVALILVWTLRETGCDLSTILILTLLVVLAGVCQITYGIWVIVPRLKGEIRRLQRLDIFGAATRLVLTAIAAATFLDARSALLVSLIAFAAQLLMLRHWMLAGVDLKGPIDLDVRREMKAIVLRQWPNEVNGVFQGQISVVLLSFFGTVGGVADLGALTRISMVFLVLGSVMGSIVLPRYARCQDPARLRVLYIEIVVLHLLLACLPVLATIVAPDLILWVLGPRYHGLSVELVLVAVNAALMSVAGVTWGLNTVRGWIFPWWLALPIGFATQIVAMAVIGVATVRQVLGVAIVVVLVAVITNVVATLVFSRGFSRANPPSGAFVAAAPTAGKADGGEA